MSNEKLAKLQNFIKYPRNIPAVYTSIRPDRYQYQRRAMQIHPKETKQYIRENDDASQYWINGSVILILLLFVYVYLNGE